MARPFVYNRNYTLSGWDADLEEFVRREPLFLERPLPWSVMTDGLRGPMNFRTWVEAMDYALSPQH